MRITCDLPISIDDILGVGQHPAGKVYKTNMPRSNYLGERCQGEIFLRFENMQRIGSFKIRSTFNKLYDLTVVEKHRGVVTCSTSSHVQGVSLFCTTLGIDGKVVMPEETSKSKVVATCDYSAEVVLHGDDLSNTLAEASGIAEPEDRIFIPPYDDPQVTAGQGTIGLEILEDLYGVDNVIVPTGGGGLTTDIAIAIRSINPAVRTTGVQSENIHDIAASWYAKKITSHRHAGTLTDGCDIARPGKLAYKIARQLVDGITLVSEDDIHRSMITSIQHNRAITEGAKALAYAVLLNGRLDSYTQNRKAVSLISGDNIDLSQVSQIMGFVDAQFST